MFTPTQQQQSSPHHATHGQHTTRFTPQHNNIQQSTQHRQCLHLYTITTTQISVQQINTTRHNNHYISTQQQQHQHQGEVCFLTDDIFPVFHQKALTSSTKVTHGLTQLFRGGVAISISTHALSAKLTRSADEAKSLCTWSDTEWALVDPTSLASNVYVCVHRGVCIQNTLLNTS